MLFLSADAVKYFGGNPDNIQEVGLMQYMGIAHFAYNIVGFNIRKSVDSQLVKSYLLANAVFSFGALGVALFAVFVKDLPLHSTAYFDWSLWAILGLGALYFWSRESKACNSLIIKVL